MKKVFIDGSVGTTGLRIFERLEGRADISLIKLDETKRKDAAFRKEALNRADIAFLCLPDEAAAEAVAMVENPETVIIDASTAHRTDPGFTYGFPEIGLAERIAASKRIAVPGCHACGFIALTAPLIKAGILTEASMLCCHSLTGYSGGGKSVIQSYADTNRNPLLATPGQYALAQQHKHLKEMQAVTGLKTTPVFSPIICDFYSGMALTVPLFAEQINGSADDIREVYAKLYKGPVVTFLQGNENGIIYAGAMSGSDGMKIAVYGNEERILLTALYDNLGKGASGAAVQCMNIVMGLPSEISLELIKES